jgi:hypothetical protein
MASLFRFSLRGLLVAVTITAVGIAAMLSANAWWEAAAWMATLFALAIAVLLVAYRREQQRAFWLGFAVFGGTYLALVLYSFTADAKIEPINSSLLSSNPLHYNSLATTRLTALAYQRAIPQSRQQEYAAAPAGGSALLVTTGDPLVVSTGTARFYPLVGNAKIVGNDPSVGSALQLANSVLTPNPSYIRADKFLSIGHTLWLLLIAAVGGKICQLIHRSSPRAEK